MALSFEQVVDFDFFCSMDREDTAHKRLRRSRATSRGVALAMAATNKTNHQETTALPRSRMINVSEIRFDYSFLSPPVFFLFL